MNKALILKYYRKGIYTDKHIATFVKAGFITSDEAEEIKNNGR